MMTAPGAVAERRARAASELAKVFMGLVSGFLVVFVVFGGVDEPCGASHGSKTGA
jgi:hypothetical protein